MMSKLEEYTRLVRSKNAEPFLTTIDLYFNDEESMREVKASGSLTPAAVAEAYRIPEEAVFGIYYVEGINAAKVTLYKYNSGKFLGLGDPELPEIYGTQLYVPLLYLDIEPTSAEAAR